MHLIAPLVSGIEGCELGSVDIYRRGTVTRATYYTDFEGTASVTPVASVALDSRGGGVFYVNELVNCIAKSAAGVTIRTFVAGAKAQGTEVISTSFTGTDYVGGATGASKPTTLSTVLDRWITSAGTLDFKVLVGGVATNLQTAVAALGVLFFSVKDPTYGAVGDGTTDDTSAVQAALNAASSAGGGIVFFPKGIYKINAATGLTLPAEVSLLGAGAAASVIRGDVDSGPGLVLAATGTYLRRVEGLRFDFAVATSRALLYSSAAARLAVRECYFGGSTFTGIGISLTGAGSELHCQDSTFYSTSNHIACQNGSASYVVGCTFTLAAAPTGSVVFFGASNPTGFSLIGCTFDSALMSSGTIALINATGSSGLRGAVIGNYCANPAGGTLSLWAGPGIDSASSDGVLISGNRFGTAIVRSAVWGGAAGASTYRGSADMERERARYYVADDTAGVSISSMTYACAEVVRTTTGNQTVTLDGPGPVNATFTLVYHNNHGAGGGTITMAGNVKGLTTFTVNATSVSYYFFKAVHRGTSKYWALMGSAVNQTA